MTDVTGFGLAGHLANICRASKTGATVELSKLPIYAGAEKLAAKGLRSSIFAENFKGVAISGPQTARFDLLFDPQTCGGLLAAVPSATASDVVEKLQALGFPAAAIGQITDGDSIVAI
jgi:selenide,water dikinase